MNRREVMKVAVSVAVAASLLCLGPLFAQETDAKAPPAEGNTIDPHPIEGSEAAQIGAGLFTKQDERYT